MMLFCLESRRSPSLREPEEPDVLCERLFPRALTCQQLRDAQKSHVSHRNPQRLLLFYFFPVA